MLCLDTCYITVEYVYTGDPRQETEITPGYTARKEDGTTSIFIFTSRTNMTRIFSI